MKRSLCLIALAIAACTAPAPPPPKPVPAEQPQPPAEEKAIATLRVTASALNVRKEAAMTSDVVGQVKKGDRLSLLSFGDDWDRVRLADGTVGYVSVLHVIREGSRARKGCPADAEFAFVKTPTPAFSDSGAHGVVTVDASVDPKGNVTSVKVMSNTTGDVSMGELAAREIREAKFTAPIRNCVPKAFIFTYKRSY